MTDSILKNGLGSNFIRLFALSWHSKPSPKNPSRHLHSYPPIVFEHIEFRLQSFSRSHSSISLPGIYGPEQIPSSFQIVAVMVRFSPWIPGLYTSKAQSRIHLLVYLYNRQDMHKKFYPKKIFQIDASDCSLIGSRADLTIINIKTYLCYVWCVANTLKIMNFCSWVVIIVLLLVVRYVD